MHDRIGYIKLYLVLLGGDYQSLLASQIKMQCLKKCIRSVSTSYKYFINSGTLLRPSIIVSNIHTSARLQAREHNKEAEEWVKANEKIYPVQEPGEKRRPAFVRHAKMNIKYSPKTMWFIACMVRGLTVDEAVKQLSFCLKKGAVAAKETILEAQKMAVEQHNVEFKSNLWVAESRAIQGRTVKGIRRHAKARVGHITYRYVDYLVQLEEGKPPKHYYLPEPKNKEQLLSDWLVRMRRRRVPNAL